MKIVLFKNVEHDFEAVRIITENITLDNSCSDEYIQISEVIDVDFPMLEVDLTAKKIDLIDKDIQKAKSGIELLEQAKAELRAIPDLS